MMFTDADRAEGESDEADAAEEDVPSRQKILPTICWDWTNPTH